jgi:hypothetical protein
MTNPNRPTVCCSVVAATICVVVMLVAAFLVAPAPSIPVHFAVPGAAVSFAWPWAAVWMPIESALTSMLINLARALFGRDYICHICQSKDEKLNFIEYRRGYGAHSWHLGGR